MIGYSALNKLFGAIVATGIVQNIYHSVLIHKTKDGHIKPVAPVNGSFVYVGIEDSQGFSCYCRQAGDIEVLKEERTGSFQRLYHLQVLHRLVFYNAAEARSHEDVTARLIKAVMSQGSEIRFRKAITQPQILLQQEAPTGKFVFDPLTYYCGVDFFVLLKLQADTCPQEIRCEGIPNPFCAVQ